MSQKDRNGINKVSKKSKINKGGLSRNSLRIENLKDKESVFGFDEETQKCIELRVEITNNQTKLFDSSNKEVKFIDIIFRTEKEVITYKNAPFM